jgi:glycosyltransferase involved in cell wall biosynthesis
VKEVPLVSVILPVYNAERYVKKAIESILMQDYSNIELILINDCSTDNSEHEIFKFQDERIRYVKNEKNLGLIKTLNKALLLCQGEFIARMDADDIAIQSRIRKQLQFLLENKDFVLVGSNYRVFGDKEGIVK